MSRTQQCSTDISFKVAELTKVDSCISAQITRNEYFSYMALKSFFTLLRYNTLQFNKQV